MPLFRRATVERETQLPAVNAPVYSSDGERFGYVKSMRDGYFEVAGPENGASFWLSTAYVGKAADDRVSLTLSLREVGQHRLNAPGLEPAHDPETAAVADAVLSNEEALAQRERMERELRRQRGTMDTGLQEPPD